MSELKDDGKWEMRFTMVADQAQAKADEMLIAYAGPHGMESKYIRDAIDAAMASDNEETQLVGVMALAYIVRFWARTNDEMGAWQ